MKKEVIINHHNNGFINNFILAPEPFKQLILLGITLESITLLPIFFLGRIINYDSIIRFVY